MGNPEICIVVACEQTTRAMGINNGLIWRLPTDMARFKALTVGQVVIMGRNTWDSIPEKFRPLPDRYNIVVSRTLSIRPGIAIAGSLENALLLAKAQNTERVCFIGGARIYEEGLRYADTLYLTLVDDPEKEGDVFFPSYEGFGPIIADEAKEEKGLKFRFVTMKRAAA